MKKILEYSSPEDDEMFDIANRGIDYKIVLDDLRNFLRSKLKYSTLDKTEVKVYSEVQEELFRLANERNLEL